VGAESLAKIDLVLKKGTVISIHWQRINLRSLENRLWNKDRLLSLFIGPDDLGSKGFGFWDPRFVSSHRCRKVSTACSYEQSCEIEMQALHWRSPWAYVSSCMLIA